MFRITKSDCEYAINNASKVNYQTIKIWKCYCNKINEDFLFSSQEELEQQLLNINKTYSSAYNMSSLLRATCKINNLAAYRLIIYLARQIVRCLLIPS